MGATKLKFIQQALLSELTEKTTLADADLISLADSAASYANKKITKANLQTAISESGTWTPELTFGGGNTGITYSSQTGKYRNILGLLMFYTIGMVLTSKGSSTGTATISLPITVGSLNIPLSSVVSSILNVTFTAPMMPMIVNASAVLTLYDNNSGTRRLLTDTAFANNTNIRMWGMILIG